MFLKVSPTGKVLWRTTYDGPAHRLDYVNDLALDANGNAVVVGASNGRGTGRDYVTMKVRSNGSRAWAKRYAGPDSFDEARGVAVSGSGRRSSPAGLTTRRARGARTPSATDRLE